MKWQITYKIATGWLFFAGAAQAQGLCGGPLDDNNFGRPLDYTSDFDKYAFSEGVGDKLELVESAHFNRDVETLKAGQQGPLPGDIHYTLKHFPNHYRALNSMANWYIQNPIPDYEECDCADWLLPAECYFTRALTFKPKDPVLFYILGLFLHKKGDLIRAVDAYDDAAKLGLDTAEYHYNYGLLMVDARDFEAARLHAQIAYAKGAAFPGLKNKLESAGEW